MLTCVEVGSARQTDRCADVVHSRAAVVPALEAACRVDPDNGLLLGHLRRPLEWVASPAFMPVTMF
jgi:hypothetical protein